MKLLRNILSVLTFFSVSIAGAQEPWLHIYLENGSGYSTTKMDEVSSIGFDEENGTMTVNFNDGEPETFYASKIDHFTIGHNVPALYITTDEYVTEITSKEVYLTGTLNFDGRGLADSFEQAVNIRGRGNSTWSYPKKPYRLKFSEKQRMLLPKKAKNFVLLANYIDESFMRNAAAYIFGQVIEMPYINYVYPVDVYLNDIYKGTYTLTEKVGFNNGSVDLSKEDEPNSIMFEFDTNSADDDEFPFSSAEYDSQNGYYLPVRIKDPDAPEDETEQAEWFEKWQDDLNEFMGIVDSQDPDKIFAACDLESLVRYIMVFNIACNQELDHPKSVFMYKTEGGKYYFGPCWDFDWAYGYNPTYTKSDSSDSGNWWNWNTTTYPSYENPLLGPAKQQYVYDNDGFSGEFFHILCNNDTFLTRFREVWDDFYNNKRETFFAEFDAYAALLEPSAGLQSLDTSLYQSYQQYSTAVAELREWLVNRIEYINTDETMGLWNANDTFNSER